MELQQVIQLIQATLVPVIMISAEGLVGLVIQQRYGRIIDRLRAVNYERVNVQQQMRAAARAGASNAEVAPLRRRVVNDEALIASLLRRARLARNALFAAFLGMFLFVATSFSLITEAFLLRGGWFSVLPLIFFTLGLIAFLVGFAFILVELFQSLEVSEAEVAMVRRYLETAERRAA